MRCTAEAAASSAGLQRGATAELKMNLSLHCAAMLEEMK
eukprot:CAMPEP_0204192418 /NCGR_PEP_ID=MMETSP0361-20130328/60851_1 /ASSEMBLY_ACC=CAM_ASM_000343 /TAXON_ID=268821 /ORGANISM="Scrippsiella Hangoei, Strain SHTV-5" /LENGTH=38 /DNA_ID= /DNA_START= /DNA_END= /DNA_ORIENTATION=